MSCNCKNTEGSLITACPCDKLVHPLPLNIGAGLAHLPRQIAHFPEQQDGGGGCDSRSPCRTWSGLDLRGAGEVGVVNGRCRLACVRPRCATPLVAINGVATR